MSRKQLLVCLIAFIVSAIVILTLIISSFFPPKAPVEVNLAPSPSTSLRGIGDVPGVKTQVTDQTNKFLHPDGTITQQTITPDDQKQIEKDRTIGALIKKLPFHSSTFALRYDINTNSFIVSFIQDKVSQANQEFDQFLKDNGVENRNWLYNLSVKQLTY